MVDDLRRVSPSVVLVVAAAVLAIILGGYLLATWPPEPPGASQSDAGATGGDPTAETSGQQTVLAVLGDSFSASSDASSGPEWPAILGQSLDWRVVTDAQDVTGYLYRRGGKPFGERVPALMGQHPDVVVVAGGLFDLGAYPLPEVADAADKVVKEIARSAPRAHVVLVSPFSSRGEPGPLTLELTADLRKVAEANRVQYVDATRWLPPGGDLFGSDGLHPNEQGQQLLADRMEKALSQLGLAAANS